MFCTLCKICCTFSNLGSKSPSWLIIISVLFLAGFMTAVFCTTDDWKKGFLVFSSGIFGFVLKYGKFGFTCTFRELLDKAEAKQMRDLFMFMFFATLFCDFVEWFKIKHPLFALKDPNSTFSDSGAPIGLSLILGSFFFGIGMNIGSGCASGTLVGLGEGFLKSWEVIWFFIAGATIGSLDPCYKWWSKLPKYKSTTYIPTWANLLLLAGLYLLTFLVDFLHKKYTSKHETRSIIELGDVRGLLTQDPEALVPWYKKLMKQIILAFFLALPIFIFYLCTGDMIGVMGTFAKIGAFVCSWFGAKPQNWLFFQTHGGLPKSLMYDKIFLSDCYIIFGSFLAATIARNFGKSQKKGWFEYFIGVFGGLLMGFGARMAGGCNIGAMLSGITSNSLNGYVWMICAIIGNAIPIYIKKIWDKTHDSGISAYTPIQ